MWRMGGKQNCLRAAASRKQPRRAVETRIFHTKTEPSPLRMIANARSISGSHMVTYRHLSGLSSSQWDDDRDKHTGEADDRFDYSSSKQRRIIRSGDSYHLSLLHDAFLISNFPAAKANQRRLLTTNKSPDPDNTKQDATASVAPRKDETPPRKGSQPISSMEPDFASYLSGEMKNPVEREKERIKKPAFERVGARMIALDNETEFFSQIRRLQTRRKEESRKKTAANVNRALWGNVIICTAKFGAWLSSGSSAMLSEFIHSCVDCGNQALLLVGLRDSSMEADRKHPYGYGKSIYFWALVSALGTFFLGAGVSMTHAVGEVMNPSLHEINTTVWGVLGLSFVVDGYVLSRTIQETLATKPKGIKYFQHLSNMRDPAVLAVLLEDGAACLGVVMCFGGIAASHFTGNPIWDGVAGVGISSLLGCMGLALVRMNHRFLLGQAVDRDITDDIEKILLSRRSVDSIGSVQSQWTGPETFSYKAEVDFDGTYISAKLHSIYQAEFMQIKDSMDDELQVLLALYAEDVIRTVEREVRHVEAYIRKKYPGAEYIELEPMSRDADRLAIDDNLEGNLRRVESDALNRFLKTLRKEGAAKDQLSSDAKAASIANSDPTAGNKT